jgi:hypothetical protein
VFEGVVCTEAPGGADVAGRADYGLHVRVPRHHLGRGIVTIIHDDDDADLNPGEAVKEVVTGFVDGVETAGDALFLVGRGHDNRNVAEHNVRIEIYRRTAASPAGPAGRLRLCAVAARADTDGR